MHSCSPCSISSERSHSGEATFRVTLVAIDPLAVSFSPINWEYKTALMKFYDS